MKKLRLEIDGLKVESFAADAGGRARGTVPGFEDSTCSAQPTCGIASRGEETFQLEVFTRYACCI